MTIFTYENTLLLYLCNKASMAKQNINNTTAKKFINIDYPFKDSPQGFFLNLNSSDASSIKADLMHIVLTAKGERLYNPDFGTNLLSYIFEPNDSLTLAQIQQEIISVVNQFLPNLQITQVLITQSTDSEYAAVIRIDYVISDDVFTTTDFVIINL